MWNCFFGAVLSATFGWVVFWSIWSWGWGRVSPALSSGLVIFFLFSAVEDWRRGDVLGLWDWRWCSSWSVGLETLGLEAVVLFLVHFFALFPGFRPLRRQGRDPSAQEQAHDLAGATPPLPTAVRPPPSLREEEGSDEETNEHTAASNRRHHVALPLLDRFHAWVAEVELAKGRAARPTSTYGHKQEAERELEDLEEEGQWASTAEERPTSQHRGSTARDRPAWPRGLPYAKGGGRGGTTAAAATLISGGLHHAIL